MENTFENLGIRSDIIKALKENGYENPFPIQEKSIPLILKGMDIIGQAHTGTGKTAAFSLPILTKIKQKGPIQALILVPTRELAIQVTNELNKFSKYIGIRTVSIYGGQSISIQFDQLRRGIQIVVATPGRLIDHIKRGSIQLDDVKYVVLDEADRMLDMGFIDDIKFILFYVNENRQTCLFSATMPTEILRLAQEYMNNYEEIRLNKEELTLEAIEQSYLIIRENEKFKHLCDFIKKREKNQQTIVFVSTKQRTEKILHELRDEGFRATTIHGDLSQKQRDNAIFRFRKQTDDILVATDIASRGIDVPSVGHVINYDIPEDPMTYFHRIGRTARAGAKGKAISLVSPDRIDDFTRIIKRTEFPIRKLNDEMGIDVPVVTQRHYRGDYRQRGRGYGTGQRYGNSNSGFGRSGSRYGQNRSFGNRRNFSEARERSFKKGYDESFSRSDNYQNKRYTRNNQSNGYQ
ncbi:MAG: RNA helicase [Nitrososphaeraceae archaeon]|nr:RNA helicase [Nitrososphaeraceae archaeon]